MEYTIGNVQMDKVHSVFLPICVGTSCDKRLFQHFKAYWTKNTNQVYKFYRFLVVYRSILNSLNIFINNVLNTLTYQIKSVLHNLKTSFWQTQHLMV